MVLRTNEVPIEASVLYKYLFLLNYLSWHGDCYS